MVFRVECLHVLLDVTGIGLGLVPLFMPASDDQRLARLVYLKTWDAHGWTPGENDQRAYQSPVCTHP